MSRCVARARKGFVKVSAQTRDVKTVQVYMFGCGPAAVRALMASHAPHEAPPPGLGAAQPGEHSLCLALSAVRYCRFTAEEVIGYIRLCRPGSVIGPQQNFLCDIQVSTRGWGRAAQRAAITARQRLGESTMAFFYQIALEPGT